MSKVIPIKKATKLKPEYMGLETQKQFRSILMQMKAETVAQMQSEITPIDFQRMPDDNDVASMREAATMEIRQRERVAMLIKKINKSLAKLDTNDYGYCDECGTEIGIDRLHARPTADLCISCKELAEKAEGMFSKKRAA